LVQFETNENHQKFNAETSSLEQFLLRFRKCYY
jgi:hypothetical protein